MGTSMEFRQSTFSKRSNSGLQFLVPECGPELRWKSIEFGAFSWFLDETGDMIFLINLPGGEIVDSNRSASKKLGYMASEFFGMNILDILSSKSSALLSRIISGTEHQDQDEAIEAILRQKTGAELPAAIKIRMVSPSCAILAAFPAQARQPVDDTLTKCGFELQNVTEKLRSERVENEKLAAKLMESEKELRTIPSKLMTARTEERKMFAAEIQARAEHALGSMDSGMEMVLAARDEGKPEKALNLLNDLFTALQRSMEETLSICAALQPKTVNQLGIIDTLEWLCGNFRRQHPINRLNLNIGLKEEEIPEFLKICIFRIAQEALDNVARHSKTEWVNVSLTKENALLELTVADDGIGMDQESVFEKQRCTGRGLTRIWERTVFTGGSLSIESSEGEGTTIRCVWPASIEDDERG